MRIASDDIGDNSVYDHSNFIGNDSRFNNRSNIILMIGGYWVPLPPPPVFDDVCIDEERWYSWFVSQRDLILDIYHRKNFSRNNRYYRLSFFISVDSLINMLELKVQRPNSFLFLLWVCVCVCVCVILIL